MQKSNSQQEQPKNKRKFIQKQYEMLLRCSKKKDMTEWNEWRKENPNMEILLQGADLKEKVLIGIHLENADLRCAHMEGAELEYAHMEGADLRDAHIEGAILSFTHLENAKLQHAHLNRNAKLNKVTELESTHLEGANLIDANLYGAKLSHAHLQDTALSQSYLQGADFQKAIVDGSTLLWECEVDRNTDFRGVGLDSSRIDPGTKQLLEYNIRRMNWEVWYKKYPMIRWPVQLFWQMSDYGRSTVRLILTFFILALLFASVYYYLGAIDYYIRGIKDNPGIISNLFVDQQGDIHCWLVPIRALYFSIVTMTTLGFGDMYADSRSLYGHLLLILQVILGYVLLGALVTRLAILFTAGGPAGKFTEKKKTPFEE